MTTLVLLAGCFWGTEYALREIDGVETMAGYAGGPRDLPTDYYRLDGSGHSEGVKVSFADPALLAPILAAAVSKSGGDPSPSGHPRYRRAVIAPDAATAERVRAILQQLDSDMPVETGRYFCPAEPYHQAYYQRVLT